MRIQMPRWRRLQNILTIILKYPPSPYRPLVASPFEHPKKSSVRVSGMSRVAAAETSAKLYRVFRGTGVKAEPVSSGNSGRAAAVLSSGGVFAEGKKAKNGMGC